MYNEKIMNEFFNPQNVGVIKGASGKGKIVSPINREIMKIYITVDGDKITNAMFQTFGCVVAIAATSVATRMIIGKTLDEANALTSKDILAELGNVPEEKKHFVEMAVETVYDAVKSYEIRKSGGKRAIEDDD